MLRSILLVCAAILAALVFACVPPPAPPVSPPPVVQAGGTPICAVGQIDSATKFAQAVQVLQPKYVPDLTGSNPPEANVQQGYKLRKEIITDLSNAFSNAPPVVQNRLCNLTGVFIGSTGCPNGGDVNNCGGAPAAYLFSGQTPNAWGFRGKGNARGNTYIAISGGLWSFSGYSYAEPLSTYENSILQYFTHNWRVWPSITTTTPPYAAPDNSWMSVLAALAHELGHVRRAEIAIPNGYGNNYDFTALTQCSIGSGQTTDFYSGWSYGSDPKHNLAPRGRWRSFSDNTNAGGNTTDHAILPILASLTNNQALDQLLQSTQPNAFNVSPPVDQPWPSLFAAQNPDEDFAETYALYALLGNKLDNPGFTGTYLQNLPVTIPLSLFSTDTRDVASDLLNGYKPTLQRKMLCLENLQ